MIIVVIVICLYVVYIYIYIYRERERDIDIYIYIYSIIHRQARSAREFRDVVFEAVGFEHIGHWPSTAEGVGTSLLKLRWVRGF